MNSHGSLLLVALLLVGGLFGESVVHPRLGDGTTLPARSGTTLAQFEKMEFSEALVHVRELKDRGNIAELDALARSGAPCADFASGTLVSMLPTEKAIDVVRRFPIGSLKWGSALHALRDHPVERVEGFLRDLCASENRVTIRYECYLLCEGRRWDILADYAAADRDRSELLPPQFNGDSGDNVWSLGDFARKYLRTIEEATPPSQRQTPRKDQVRQEQHPVLRDLAFFDYARPGDDDPFQVVNSICLGVSPSQGKFITLGLEEGEETFDVFFAARTIDKLRRRN